MKLQTGALAAVAVLTLAAPAHAVEPYVGGQYLMSYSKCQGYEEGVAPLGLIADCDTTASGWRANAGLNLTDNFGLEVGYQDAGDGKTEVLTAAGARAFTLTTPVKAWDAVVTLRKELSGGFQVVARVGAARWDYEVQASDNIPFGAENEGTSLTYGAGFKFKWLTVGYDAIRDVGEGNRLAPTAPEIKQTLHRGSVGLEFRFGGK